MKSVSTQILASILITMIIVFGGWGIIEIKNTTEYEKERLEKNQMRIAERLAFNLAYSLWNLNLSEVEKNIQDEAVDENIRSIQVFDENGELYAGIIRENVNGNIIKFDRNNIQHKQLYSLKPQSFIRQILYKEKPIGKVVIYTNEEPFQLFIKQLRFNFFQKLIILIFVIAVVLFIILRKVVIKPLSLLKDWVSSIEPNKILPPPKLFHSVEIDTLLFSFSKMTDRLGFNLKEIFDKNLALIEREKELNDSNKELISAKEELQKSEEKYRILIDNANEAIIVVQEGMIKFVNFKASKVTGYSERELISKPLIDFLHADDCEMVTENHKKRIKDELVPARYSFRIITNNGAVVWVETGTTVIIWQGKPATLNFLTDITERKHAEETLHESERLLRESQSIAHLGSYAWNLLTGFWSSSKILDDIFGINDNYVRSLDGWASLIHPDWQGKMTKYVTEEVVGKRQKFDKEYKIIRKSDGKELWVHGLGEVEFDNNNQPIKLIGTISDISARKLAEEALRESEERYKSIISVSNTGAWEYHSNKDFLWCSPEYFTMLGLNRADFDMSGNKNLKETWIDLLHPDDRESDMNCFAEYLKNGSIGTYENYFRMQHRNGSWIWIWSRGQTLRDANGDLTNLTVGTHIDITERLRAEEALRKLKKAVDNSSEVIFMTDKEGVFTYANPAFTSIYGFTADEIIGKETPRIIKSGLLSENDYKQFWETLLSRKEVIVQYINKRKDGTLFNVEGSATSILDDKKNIIGFLGIQRDITERKRAEKELIEAKEKAEEMNRVKNYFLSNMSHELRTPLISVLGFAELLQNELNEPEHLEFANHILEGGQRLNNTLTSILEMSKLESAQSFLELKPLNLAGEIETSVKSFLPKAQSKKLFLNTETRDTYLQAHIDGELFSKALYHLLNNAIKFTKQGGITVSLDHERKQENDWAVIKVIDTGVGIPSEEIDKIFEAFRQSSEGDSRSHEGTGLGLTIAKRIVELMKGSIQVESETGKGSVFSIWLPAVLDQSQIKTKVEELGRTTMIEPPTTKEKGLQKVLIVDDNSSNRLFMNHCLSKYMRVIEAEDGLSSVSISSKEHFDLVLMDINLGAGIDGVEAMHQVRKVPSYIRVPIIAVTAYVMPGDKERFLNEGFDSYLGKPFTKDALVSLVKETLAEVKK